MEAPTRVILADSASAADLSIFVPALVVVELATESDACTPDWGALPGDLKRLIMDKLALADCSRLAQVSRSFHAAARKHHSALEMQAQAAAYHAQKRQRNLKRIEDMLRPVCCGRCVVWFITHWWFTTFLLLVVMLLAAMFTTGVIFVTCSTACGWKSGPAALARYENYRPGHSVAFPFTDANTCTVRGSLIQHIRCGGGSGAPVAKRVIFNVSVNGLHNYCCCCTACGMFR